MSNVRIAQAHILDWFQREGWAWSTSHQEVLSGMMAGLLAGESAAPHVLAASLPLDIQGESKIQKVRRLLDSPKLSPTQLLPTLVRIGVALRPDPDWLLLSLDRTEYQQRRVWVQMLCWSLRVLWYRLPGKLPVPRSEELVHRRRSCVEKPADVCST